MKRLLLNISLAVWFVIWAPLILLALPSKKLSRKFLVSIAWGIIFIARIIGGIKYKIHNYRLPTAVPAFAGMTNNRLPIIASKHMSMLETAILGAHIPNVFFIMKRELMWIPIYGWNFWRIGLQPVDRAAGATNMNKLCASVKNKIDAGMTLAIFPEGTRTKPGQKIKLKRGLLFIAEKLHYRTYWAEKFGTLILS